MSPAGSVGKTNCTCKEGTGLVPALEGSLLGCNCPAGTRRLGEGVSASCEACRQGQLQSLENQATCVACQPGRTTNGTGASNKSQCICVAGKVPKDAGDPDQPCECPIGTVAAGDACVDCAANQYGKGSLGSASCGSCPLRSVSTRKSVGIGNCSCTDGAMVKEGLVPSGHSSGGGGHFDSCSCPLGYLLVGSSCVACAEGKYAGVANQATCSPCPSGRTTNGTGASNASQCVCVSGMVPTGASSDPRCICPPGHTKRASGGGCDTCGLGQYGAAADASSCTACPEGTTTTDLGATEEEACVCVRPEQGPGGAELFVQERHVRGGHHVPVLRCGALHRHPGCVSVRTLPSRQHHVAVRLDQCHPMCLRCPVWARDDG